jgi:hypothetical protein
VKAAAEDVQGRLVDGLSERWMGMDSFGYVSGLGAHLDGKGWLGN